MYDLLIIGGGPAGYLAAERAGARGLRVLLVEKDALGGTCLNVGCIPTKSLLNSAKHYVHAKEAAQFGVIARDVTFDLATAMAWKSDVVSKLVGGIAAMLKKYKVEVLTGTATVEGIGKVRVTGATGSEIKEAKTILIATGSSPVMPPIPGSKDNTKVVDSTGMLALKELPKHLAVIGGGVIGIEFASFAAALGTKVTVVEMMDEIIPFMDSEQAPQFRKALHGIDFRLGCKVEKLDGGTVHFTTKDGKAESIQADLVLMAVGRKPNITGVGLEQAAIEFTPRGIVVDEYMQTNLPGVYAAGDVTGKSQLAHSAYRMGEIAVANAASRIAGEKPKQRMRMNAIPWAVYSLPEAAGAGITEQEAKKLGREVRTASVSLKASGRFGAENGFKAPGSMKLIVDAHTDAIIGFHAFGPYCSEYVWGAVPMIEAELRASDLREMILPHPTLSELIRDCAWELAH